MSREIVLSLKSFQVKSFRISLFPWKYFRVHSAESFARRINIMSHKNAKVILPRIDEWNRTGFVGIYRGNLYSANEMKGEEQCNHDQNHRQNRRMKWKKENKSKVEGGEGLDESPEPPTQWSEVTLYIIFFEIFMDVGPKPQTRWSYDFCSS